MPELLYKSTGRDGVALYGRGQWIVGKSRTVTPPLALCRRGIHYCTRAQIVYWLGSELWLFEDEGDTLNGDDKRCTTKGRITERVVAWNDRNARLFAADCAEHVLPIFLAVRPDDDRPRLAIEAARAFANGEIGAAARAAARAAAGEAAGAAAGAAAGEAAGAAAGAAARAAAGEAAGAAAGAAARAAARAAAGEAAGAAAGEAARAAAGEAARAAERGWQTERLFSYLA